MQIYCIKNSNVALIKNRDNVKKIRSTTTTNKWGIYTSLSVKKLYFQSQGEK